MNTEITIKADTERITELSTQITADANILIDISEKIRDLQELQEDIKQHLNALKAQADTALFLSDETVKANPREPFARTANEAVRCIANEIIPSLCDIYYRPMQICDTEYNIYPLPEPIRTRYSEELKIWKQSQNH